MNDLQVINLSEGFQLYEGYAGNGNDKTAIFRETGRVIRFTEPFVLSNVNVDFSYARDKEVDIALAHHGPRTIYRFMVMGRDVEFEALPGGIYYFCGKTLELAARLYIPHDTSGAFGCSVHYLERFGAVSNGPIETLSSS